MSLEFNPVPLDGSIHPLPAFLDYYMDLAPSTPFAKFPSIDDPDKVTTISYSDFAKATHRVAHALCPDGVGTKGEVVAVLVHCDSILYMALLIGMMRAGMVVRISLSLLALVLLAHKISYEAVPNVTQEFT